MAAILSAFQMMSAAAKGVKALATLKKPPSGTKTVTFNFAALLGWALAKYFTDLPPEIIDSLVVGIMFLGNLIIRKLTKGPMAGD